MELYHNDLDQSGFDRYAGEPTIFHIDVNSAFLSWSAVARLREDPDALDLREVPSIVCGDVESRHGIVTAKSIPAKKYGIQTAEPVMSALKKCPDLIRVKGDFNIYRKYSADFIEILHRFAPVVEQVSIDEAYLDMTGTRELYRDFEDEEHPWPISVAKKIRDTIHEELGFTVNVGISVNKLLAKTASDFAKPNKIHTLYPHEIPRKFWPMPIGDLHGCGKQTAARLNRLGIFTIGEAAHMDKKILMAQLGEKAGSYIYNSCNGISNSIVSDERQDVKSVSNETTTSEDITLDNYADMAPAIVRALADSVGSRMRKKGVFGSTLSISVKSSEFARFSRQLKLPASSNDSETIYHHALTLLDQFCLGENGFLTKGGHIRLIGVGMNNLDDGQFRQLSLFDLMGSQIPEKEMKIPEASKTPREKNRKNVVGQATDRAGFPNCDQTADHAVSPNSGQPAGKEAPHTINRKKQEKLDAALDSIRDRFGKNAVRRASTLEHEMNRLKED